MSWRFLPLLAFEEFDNTAKYSLGRGLLGAQQASSLRKEGESHMIKEETAEIGGKGAHLMQEFKAQKYHRGEGGRSPLIRDPQRKNWRQQDKSPQPQPYPHPKVSKQKMGDGIICFILNQPLSGFCQLQSGVLGISVLWLDCSRRNFPYCLETGGH